MQASTRVQRFSFVSFGQEKIQVPPPVEEIAVEGAQQPVEAKPVLQERIVREEELHRARSEGRDQGYKEGVAAAEAKFNTETSKREEAVKGVLEAIANRVTIAASEHAAYVKERQDILSRAVVTIARKVAGDALKAEPYAGIEATLRECLAVITGEPKIAITVPSGTAAGLRQRVDTMRPLLGGFAGEMVVEENAELQESDCRVEWGSGYVSRDTAALWSEIENIISRTRTL